MENTKKWFGLLSLLLVGVLTSAYSCSLDVDALAENFNHDFDYEETINLSKELSGITRLLLDNTLGAISISGWDQPHLQMTVTKRAKTQQDLKNVTFTLEASNGALSIKTKHPQVRKTRWAVAYELQIPFQMNLDLDQGAGTIDIRNIEGNVVVDLGTGTVVLDNLTQADLKLDLGTGEARINGLIGNQIDIDIGVGELHFHPQTTLPFSSVQVDVGTGGATLDGVQAQSIKAEIGVGELEVGLFQDASLNFSAHVGMGEVSIRGFDSLQMQKRSFMSDHAKGSLGAGEGSLSAEVGMGQILIYSVPRALPD